MLVPAAHVTVFAVRGTADGPIGSVLIIGLEGLRGNRLTELCGLSCLT